MEGKERNIMDTQLLEMPDQISSILSWQLQNLTLVLSEYFGGRSWTLCPLVCGLSKLCKQIVDLGEKEVAFVMHSFKKCTC